MFFLYLGLKWDVCWYKSRVDDGKINIIIKKRMRIFLRSVSWFCGFVDLDGVMIGGRCIKVKGIYCKDISGCIVGRSGGVDRGRK